LRKIMKNLAKPPSIPADRQDTLRHQIITLLSVESLTAMEMSERLGIPEEEVLEHLEHVRIALRTRLVVVPALCMECGFFFRKRGRLKGPGRCPVCRNEHIAEPRFSIG